MDETTDKTAGTRISLTLTKVYIEALDQLVEAGVFASTIINSLWLALKQLYLCSITARQINVGARHIICGLEYDVQ